MTALLLAALIAATCTEGNLSQYAERPTRAVIANRSVPGRTAWDMPDDWYMYDVLLAVESCDRLGETGVVFWHGHSGTYIAYDCAGSAATRAWMRRGRIVAEVDGWTAQRWNSVGRGMKNAVICKDTSTVLLHP